MLRLTNGTKTLVLSGGGSYLGCTYFPQSQPGAERLTESFPVILEGTETAIRGAVNDIELLLQAARGRGDTPDARVYAEFRPTDTGDIFSAEVYDGLVQWSQVPAERMLGGTLNTVRVVVTWERAAGWLGPEAALSMSSAVSTERLSGVFVYNNDNAGNPNWAAMLGTNIKGTRPSPVRLKITNSSGAALGWRVFHVGLNAYSDPTNADLWLLGSEAVGGAAKSWSAGVDHNNLQWLFALEDTLLGQTMGRTFRVLATFTSTMAAANLRCTVGSYIDGVFAPTLVGKERVGTRELLDLGEFAIPPGGYGAVNSAAGLAVTVRSAAAGSGTLDFVMLMPTDSYRRLEQTGYIAPVGNAIVDDAIDGVTYALSGTSRLPIVRGVGDGLRVHPGRDQRLYILFDEGANFAPERRMTVQAWYRPLYDAV